MPHNPLLTAVFLSMCFFLCIAAWCLWRWRNAWICCSSSGPGSSFRAQTWVAIPSAAEDTLTLVSDWHSWAGGSPHVLNLAHSLGGWTNWNYKWIIHMLSLFHILVNLASIFLSFIITSGHLRLRGTVYHTGRCWFHSEIYKTAIKFRS